MSKKQKRYIPALSYNWLTFIYDPLFRLLGREMTIKRRLVAQAQIAKGQRILDIGCGTATLTILIKKMHPEAEVTGLDGDPKILKIARTKASRSGLHINLVERMSYDLPYLNESYDHVFASLMIHHLSEKEKSLTFSEVLRILKTGGELHVAEFGKPHNTYTFLVSLFMRHIEATSQIMKGLLPEMLRRAGFIEAIETARFTTFLGNITLYKARKRSSKNTGSVI